MNFKADPVTPNYYITFQKDLQRYDENNLGQIFNKVYFTYNGGSKTYTDATSITAYGTREITMDDQSIINVTTADLKIQKYLEENAYPQENRELIVNRGFSSFEIIKPGEQIKILNFSKVVIGNVEKMEYSRDQIKLILNKNLNLVELLKT